MKNKGAHGLLHRAIQAVWLVLIGVMLIAFAAGVPRRFIYLVQPPEVELPALYGELSMLESAVMGRLSLEEVEALEELGLSQRTYAVYVLAFELGLVLVSALIGGFIFWRRPDDWLTLWISFLLILLSTNGPVTAVIQISPLWPAGILGTTLIGWFGMISNVHILFLLPDGRFVPRWTLRLAAGFTGGMLGLAGYLAAAYFQGWHLFRIVGLAFGAFPFWFSLIVLGVLCQVYRYLRVSSPVQRQQTKWMVVGLAGVVLAFALNAYFLFAISRESGLGRLQHNLIRPPAVALSVLLLPVSLAFSILRYKLWDIDLIIRRTLLYSSLTAMLALIYIACVIFLQALFGTISGESQSEFVTIASTLAIAALFVPLRQRLQDAIDRLFYRRKYDGEKILAALSQSLRSEVELEQMTGSILRSIAETIQPTHASLWLGQVERRQAPVEMPAKESGG